ncbi:cholesteryl ester transfer protein [Dicentrarchus labrax]|uniref:Cholesteryl ester transfer protein n=1 Tax=Dicentrarchus labrax TaxID=13489 RepID=A0A8P4GKM6_DICLA|nr:cholesteryl ester transfer protein [Dicentrarchus labrax]XP_051238651.1 cholesteryl ester transfer protein [Dicentrarchus labrax]
MPCDGSPPLLLLLLFLSVFGASHACLQDPASAYRFTGAVCRLTYPAAVVLNEKTTKVIEAAFQHARYPDVRGEKSLLFIGKVIYGLENLEIHNLSIGRSEFELRPGEGIGMKISNVSAVFRGTIQYGYGGWLVNVTHSIDFEIESQIDLGINPKLYCGGGKVAADTSDCYLNFHKLHLQLQGDKEPNWLKKLVTNFITFTVRVAIKGQICKEINKVANILADFIQDTAEHFLTDGNISVDIGVTASPAITANYIESYHKGLTKYNNTSAVISDSVFHPSQLTENRMLYFWLSDQVFNPMLAAAHQDGRFQLNISGAELTELFKTSLSTAMPEFIRKCLLESGSPELRVWSSSVPHLNTSTIGTTVWVMASGQLHCGSPDTPTLFFETDVAMEVTVSYADKKLFLHGNPTETIVVKAELPLQNQPLLDQTQVEFIREAVEKIGIPKVLSALEIEITRLLDKQGVNLFDIFNPVVLPRDGFVVIEMDFGFPHHLLVEFLRKTLQ